MVSGMDTESLVTALVSGYQLKKDNLVKAQTKLSWKQEKWKTRIQAYIAFIVESFQQRGLVKHTALRSQLYLIQV